MGLSLSVHQGKGLTDAEARLGAILEGLEAHFGEQYEAPVTCCRYADLPSGIRPPALSDFLKDSALAVDPDHPIEWVEAERWGGGALAVPLACVSMDFTQMLDTNFDRSSNGIAVGSSWDEAVRVALLELIERDAVTEWKAGSMIDRMRDQIEPDTVEAPWFDFWSERVRFAGALLRCYRVPSITGVPVMASEIGDAGKSATPFQAIHGHAAHSEPEVALFRAITEAIQGRSAYIAGSRDDLLPSQYFEAVGGLRVAFGMPLPPGMDGTDFATIATGPSTANEMILTIERAGLGPVAVVNLGLAGAFHVVRVIACGLGARKRRRRILR